tara:strand:+ start:2604 stop:3722 length:1119 start_codon:yes stop_codon:yes gene_type:complete
MKNDYQIIIIGSGVIGLSIAKSLSKKNYNSVLVIEKEDSYGKGISSRNSEVIHSGVYYKKNTLKSKLCIEGNKKLFSFCKEYSVWNKKCGKLIVGQKHQSSEIYKLYQNAITNDIGKVNILKKNDISSYENYIKGDIALFIASTGIISSHQLMDRLYTISCDNHHDYLFKSVFIKAIKKLDGYSIELKNYYGKKETVTSDWVINCGGLSSDSININKEKHPGIYYSKGSYFKLSSRWRNKFKHLVYPIPDKMNKSLGVHITIDKSGFARLGPNAQKILNREEDYFVDEKQKKFFFNEAKKYIKSVKLNDLEPDYSGIRPKINTINNSDSDFYIKNEKKSGFPNWINLIGIESPGLTASLAIGDHVLKLIENE